MTRNRLLLLVCLFALLIVAQPALAQSTDFTIAYGETQSAFFENDTFTHRWIFFGQARDVLQLRAHRIAGQFTPRLRLLDGAGNLLAESAGMDFTDVDELLFSEGLPQDGPYQIEVNGVDVLSSQSDNPAEYSLTLTPLGQRRADPDAGFAPLPEVGTRPAPDLRFGDPTTIDLQIEVYGAVPEVLRSDTPDIPVRWLIQADERQIAVNNSTTPIVRGVSTVSFLSTGMGVLARNEGLVGERTFFSDEEFTIAYLGERREYTFTLSSGTVIITDFFRVRDIQVQDGIVAVRFDHDGSIRRFVSDGTQLDVRRLAGSETEEAVNQIDLGDGQFLTTDLQGFDTAAYVDGQLRVSYGSDARFITDDVRLFLRQNNDNPLQHDLALLHDVPGSATPRRVAFTVDWTGMGDVRIADGTLLIAPLDGRSLQEPLAALNSVLIEARSVRVARRDGSFRTSLLDGTTIDTPAELPGESDVLPHEAGFRSRNANNLGRDFLPTSPSVGDTLENQPVNPANGNFFYTVTDFSIPSHSLPLEWVRYYNSQDATQTPAYMRGTTGRSQASFGVGWRHSYQYELDISGAPLGRIRLILPSGTQHYFSSADDERRWTSRTLLAWTVEQQEGAIGRWVATDGAGRTLHFDRAGRLERISESASRSISLSPMPLSYGSGGLFIVEPYGRRLELYAGASGLIEVARDTAARQVRYSYEDDSLVGVEYNTPTHTARYAYDEAGALVRYDDVRSPYVRTAEIAYDEQRRVIRFTENPAGDLVREYRYAYAQQGDERTMRQTVRVGDEPRTSTWVYNGIFQLIRRTTPRDGYDYAYTYDENQGTLTSYRTPTRTLYQYEFDARGNLIRYTDPFFIGESVYVFQYEQRAGRSLLTEIRYPNNSLDRFEWSEGDVPRLRVHERLVSLGLERVTYRTRYEYDDIGRVVMIVQPGDIATLYRYDDFGYVAAIWQGVQLEDGETYDDITERSRALRILQVDYDLIGQVRAITDGRGQRYTLNWDSSTEQLRQVNATSGVFIRYTYDERGRVTLVDDRGQETLYTYNGLDEVTSVVDASGAVLTFAYDEVGNVLSVVDDLQRETRYAYDELDRPTEHISPSGLLTRYESTLVPEGDFLVRREVQPNGRIIERRYDALGRLRLHRIVQDDFVQEFRIEYNALGWPVQIIDVRSGRSLGLSYNLAGQVTALDVAGSRTEFTYNEQTRLASVTSPAGRVWQYGYDALGNITQVTQPDGSFLGYTYDENSNLLSATDTGGLVTNYVYDALNQLISVEDSAGNIQGYGYDLRGNLISVIDPRGISETFSYDALDRLVAATDGRGQTTSYEYDRLGRLFNIQQPGVRSTRLTYDVEDNIIAVTERPREQRTLYSYDALGRITSITDPLGHSTAYTYDPLGRITRVVDSLGNEERYQWLPEVLGFVDGLGRQYSINRDELGRVTTIRDLNTEQNIALNTEFFYDADGYLLGVQSGTDQARVSGANDLFYRVDYSPNGLPLRYLDPLDGEWRLEYDAAQRLVALTNPLGSITRYEYDAAGDVVQVIRAAGTEQESIEQYEYDGSGNITRYTSPSGVVNSYVYDQNNRLLQATLAQGTDVESRYTFEYNPLGQLIRVEDPAGRNTRYFYSLGEITRVEHPLGDETIAFSYSYDDAGNLREVTLPGRDELLNSTIAINITYDALNRRVRYVDGENSVWSYTYDAEGNVVQVSDPLGSVVRYEHDSVDRVSRIVYPTGSVVDLSYDTAGNLRTVTLPPNGNDERQTIIYRLDVLGHVEEIQQGSSSTRYEYDALGNVTRRVLPDGTETRYEYDAAGNLRSIQYEDRQVSYAYDAEGRVVLAGDVTYEYDSLGRVLTETQEGFRVRYTYDSAGNVLERDAGALGTTRYAYDDLDRPVQIDFNGQVLQIVYNERDQIRQMIRSNGVRTAINYDAAGRPVSILHLGADNSRLDGFNYQYDAVGNLIRVDRLTDGWRVLYSYDVAHRLIDERWLNDIGESVYTVSFRYDDAGNRIEELRNGQRTLFLYNDQNQLVGEVRNYNPQGNTFIGLPGLLLGIIIVHGQKRRKWLLVALALLLVGAVQAAPLGQSAPLLPDVRYEYDSAGNLSRIRFITAREGSVEQSNDLNFTYDAEGRLVAVTGVDEQGQPVDTEYRYDSLSRLVEWRAGDERHQLFYAGDTLLGMSDGSGYERYLTLEEQRLFTFSADDTALWHLNDFMGSTRRFASASGALVESPASALEFGSFGTRITPYDGGIAPDNAQAARPAPAFAGHLFDPSTGLYLMGQRAYRPETGVFLQPDPIRQDPIGTLYTYARNRPFVFTDPDGLQAVPIIDPMQAATATRRVQPERFLPASPLPELPAISPTQHLQSQESFRALELLRDLRYGTNAVVGRLSPLLDDFYLFALNPMPQRLVELDAAPLHALMSVYAGGESWLPDPLPDPSVPRNPFQVIRETDTLLARVARPPMQWRSPEVAHHTILPDLPRTSALAPSWQIERELVERLQPVPLMAGLPLEVEALRSLDIDIQPHMPAPQATLDIPNVSIEPPVLHDLDELRRATHRLRSLLWQPGGDACQDCLPALGFSR